MVHGAIMNDILIRKLRLYTKHVDNRQEERTSALYEGCKCTKPKRLGTRLMKLAVWTVQVQTRNVGVPVASLIFKQQRSKGAGTKAWGNHRRRQRLPHSKG